MCPRDGKIRVLIAAKERNERDQIRQLLLARGDYEVAGTAVDGQEAVQLTVLLRPDVVLLNADLPIFSGLEAAEMIGLAVPEAQTIMMSDGDPDARVLRTAMKSGFRACLSSPVCETELRQTMESLLAVDRRRTTAEFRTATDPNQLPKIVAVTGGKGGIGKTTIATSLAVYLAQSHPGKVVLIDMYTQFGDVASMLNITPSSSLSDLVRLTDQMDLEMLESYMVELDPGLKVLVSATKSQPIDAISVAGAEAIIYNLKRAYTHIIVDLPPILHSTTLYLLSHCYQMLLITNLFDIPAVRDAKEFYDAVVGTYVPEEKVVLVANRVSKYDHLSLADLERIFARPVSVRVPNDRRLVSAINQGVPFVRAYARSPIARAVDQISRGLTHESAAGSED